MEYTPIAEVTAVDYPAADRAAARTMVAYCGAIALACTAIFVALPL